MARKNHLSLTNRWRLRQLRKVTRQISSLESEYVGLSNVELASKTQEFRSRLADGEELDDLLVEAFATVRETCRRTLGQFPYDVQVMGAIALHQGMIAEMKTGEGKTITATMPLYLNALTGKSVILVTTNEYLAKRDAEEMSQVFQFLGLSVGLGINEDSDEKLEASEKKTIYASDIVYTTSTGLGFDYLADNLASSPEEKFLRPFHYVIVDEADAVLLDNAQTPLIISGSPRVQSNLYAISDQFIYTLDEDDFYFDGDKRIVYFTDKGLDYAQDYFDVPDLFANQYWELNRQLNLALRAHYLYQKDRDYVVDDDEVKLLDGKTGRILEGTRLQSGIHQAIEMKERVKLTKESRAIASVTYQSLFNLFPKLAGMTGTAQEAEEELIETYKLPVVPIPTNRPLRRVDYPDLIYTSLPEKLYATIALVKDLHAQGQPVLLISGTVEVTEIYSKLLLQEGIPHSTLTAKNAVKEAQIIAEAGQKGAVTCATVMAGRGTDIKLGEGVAELGGLAVIGTERMTGKRMDGQLIGRSGRQGDPGFSQFFVSLEDELLITQGPKWLKKYYKKHADENRKNYGKPLSGRRFRRSLNLAQDKSEDKAALGRQNTIHFDESLRVQRQYVYELRNRLIFGEDDVSDKVTAVIAEVTNKLGHSFKGKTLSDLRRYILDNFSYRFRGFPANLDMNQPDRISEFLTKLIEQELALKKQELVSDDAIAEFYRLAMLKAIDDCWVEEVDSLQQLKGVVSTRKNGMTEYYRESLEAYDRLSNRVRELIVRNLMLSSFEIGPTGRRAIYFV